MSGAQPAGKSRKWAGDVGTNDNDVIYMSKDTSTHGFHTIAATGGSVDVHVSLDGINFIGPVAVTLHDDVTAGGGVRVTSIPAGKFGVLEGVYRMIRVDQNSVTAANAYGAHSIKHQ